MELIDTHTHLYGEEFDEDRKEAVVRAKGAGVKTLLLPAIDSQSTKRQQQMAEEYSDCCYEMAGLHPTSVTEDYETELQHVRELLDRRREHYVAIGEIGLDLYWDKTFEEQQKEVLRTQMKWAQEMGLPVALHVRKAHNELFGLLRDLNQSTYRGVMHCFGGSVREAQKAIEMGFHIGVGGVVTFKNATLANVATDIPLERIVLETDSPYLSPVPHRGQRNESAYVSLVAQKIAELRGITVEEVAEITTANARRLFMLRKNAQNY